ncbi:heme peroxidase [Mycolicibacterium goodii]|uniref:heme peroxidase n=1 Tax=Mycolicibacterium goodii TaxID=134601 RepID=UPI0009593D25|nr:heme peroxidase [Mycolicibacterium goodii]OKH66615.1 hypothetical protein EB74_03960 [Mycobacterium sp. SWH-M5]ULN46188.1 heme peroxidase [Mycolicibacterium goodii]
MASGSGIFMAAGFTGNELTALVDAIDRDLGDPGLWSTPDGYPASLALCIVDSVFSIGVRYQGVVSLVNRYRRYRLGQSGNADADGGLELMGTFQHLGGPDGWAAKFGNRQRTSTQNGILKAEAVLRETHALADHGVWSVRDLRKAGDEGRLPAIKSDWTRVPGQRSGISWSYFLMLARAVSDDGNSSGVKPDRMIKRYVASAIGTAESHLTEQKAATLVKEAANAEGYDVIALDHAIWRFESGRSTDDDSES